MYINAGSDQTCSLAAAVTAKLEYGNVKAAARILCSADTPAPTSRETWAELCLKHPTPPPRHNAMPPPPEVAPYQATEEEIWDSIRYFSAGSAGGPDGLRPQHVTVRGAKCKDIESNGATWKLWNLGMADPNQKVIVDEKYGQVNPRSNEAPDK